MSNGLRRGIPIGLAFGAFHLALGIPFASATTTLFAEAPATVSQGIEAPVQLKARVSESVNALRMTVAFDDSRARFERFEDADSAVRLWLQRGVMTDEGLVLEGVIPGGIGPGFTDIIDVGTLWVTPEVSGTFTVSFTDAEVYLNQPTPTMDTVRTEPLTVRVGTGDVGPAGSTDVAVLDTDVRIVRDALLNGGRRVALFDIKTDKGTIEQVRIRERWLGLFGSWRDARSPSTLSDQVGLSILDVALPASMGGAVVGTVIPRTLKVAWILIGIAVLYGVRRHVKKRS